MKGQLIYLCFITLFIMLPSVYAQIIPDFQVNESVSDTHQALCAIAIDSSGNFVITWEDRHNSNSNIYAQRYSSDGTALGSNFKVNNNIESGDRNNPSIASDSDGNFVIAWVDDNYGEQPIYAQRYSSDGTALGDNFLVRQGGGSSPSISSDDSGNFVITWHVYYWPEGQDTYAKRYSSDGTALGSNFLVNQGEVGGSSSPSISSDSYGNFVITWNSDETIVARCFSSNGTPLGISFEVNNHNQSAFQGNPSISSDSYGNFIITWEDVRNEDRDIYAQRYSSDGTALGSNFKVNNNIESGDRDNPSISSDGDGNFVIAWDDYRDGDVSIYAQRYSSNGIAIGGNFKVTNTGYDPDVILLKGKIYTTWTDNRGNGTGYDIWANVLDWNDPTTGIDEKDILKKPSIYRLSQNYPNPFNPKTIINYELPITNFVELSIYNLLGQKVATLVSEKMPAGDHQVEFNGQNLSSGVYLYRIEAGEWQDVKKMILLR